MASALRTRQFRLLFVGQSVSYVGDQFHLIALPWLVLSLTHDPLQLGGVLAAAGIPRALLMLVGGVWADRYSPRTIMLVSDAARFVLTAALAAAVLTGNAQVWMIYVLAAAFGIVSGFFLPASQATMPRVLDPGQLGSGNAMIMGSNQLANFIGPVAAGVVIAAFGSGISVGGEQAASLLGIGVAFAVDAVTFLVSAVALLAMRPVPPACAAGDTHPLSDVVEGMRYTLASAHLRSLIAITAVANFLIAGPMFVGMPVLAQTRLGGAAAFGAVMSAYALGSLIGMVVAGALPRPKDALFGWLVTAMLAGFGASMALLAYLSATWMVVVLMVVTGLGNGFIGVHAITSLQRMTAERYLGRVMSMVTLAMVGLMPVSQALAGAVIRISPVALFAGAGAGFGLLAVFAGMRRGVWRLEGGTGSAGELEPATA